MLDGIRCGGDDKQVDYDLVVVGGGAGGLSSARAGARRGLTTLLISDGPPGGDCTFTGCVPSKTLLESARQGLPFSSAMERVRTVVSRIAASEDAGALKSEGIEVMEGRARFVGPTHLAMGTKRIAARRIVIATGSAPAVPPDLDLETGSFLTNETVFDLTLAPRSMAIVGAGPVGCELAQAYRRFGIDITLIETRDRLHPGEDPEAGSALAKVLMQDGIDIRLGSTVSLVQALGPGQAEVRLRDRTAIPVERLLVAVGRRPVTDGLDPEAGGVRLDDRGFIVTNDRLATSSPFVFAVGDVTGRLSYTHAADEMGRAAVANAFGRWGRVHFRTSAIPRVTFTNPEIAAVGMSEAAAAEGGGRVAFLPIAEVDRAITADRTDGFVKLLAGPRRIGGNIGGGRLLGATVMSERGGELIHEAALAIRTGMFTGRLAQTVHAYPTWSMAIRQAAGQFFAQTGGRQARPARRDAR